MGDVNVLSVVRVTVIASGLAVVISLFTVGGALITNDHRVDDIQESRVEAARRLCEARNDDHRAIRLFVKRSRAANPPPVRVPEVDAAFPIERDCSTYAARQVRLP